MQQQISAGLAAALVVLTSSAPADAQSVLQKTAADDSSTNHWYGFSVAIDGSSAAVGDPRQLGSSGGQVHMYRQTPGGFELEDVVEPVDGHAGDGYGRAVDVDLDYQLLIVGAEGHGGVGSAEGKAYVYRHTFHLFEPPSWELEGELSSSFPNDGSEFGAAVAIDDARAVVGAPRDDLVHEDMGLIHIFKKQGPGWVIDDVIASPNFEEDGYFGESVALVGDRIFVGAPGETGVGTQSGRVYVYVHDGQGWQLESTIAPANAAAGDFFGCSVSASGSKVAIGARKLNAPGGRAYVYKAEEVVIESTGTLWVLEKELKVGDSWTFDNYGTSVALTGDDESGYKALVGDSSNNQGGAPITGAVYHFEWTGFAWAQKGKFVAADADDHDRFGAAVALSGDSVLIGSYWSDPADEANAGAAYFYTLADLPLEIDRPTISVSDGGTQNLYLNAGPDHEYELYWILGSATGASPGTLLAGQLLPLNYDAYTQFTLTNVNSAPLADSIGLLSSPWGAAAASFTLPPFSSPSLSGLTLHHAYALVGDGEFTYVSNAARLDLVP